MRYTCPIQEAIHCSHSSKVTTYIHGNAGLFLFLLDDSLPFLLNCLSPLKDIVKLHIHCSQPFQPVVKTITTKDPSLNRSTVYQRISWGLSPFRR